ncbi:insulinase family protein [Arsukibacterium indicum]|uniref:Protease 3 n=1 Tax=Arsukibacterium indicum TaxID=2848612 RepID=A0ABS6MPG6_9GAMM|nr:insulinase family protein [Arsukibacterium indicum]MBV2130279.1 insulinase family protein [Arsukibacterium indicum]
MKNKAFTLSALTAAIVSGSLTFTFLSGCTGNTLSSGKAVTKEASSGQKLIVSPNDQRQYQAITLPNQLEVVLVSDPTAEKSSAALSVDVGWLNDPKSQQGLAHFLEHMLFMGTERYPDPDGFMKFMDQHGGSRNAFTNQLTNYMFEINHSHYEEALDRFSDFFKSPLLLPEYVDKERHAVHSEWSLNRNQDGWAQRKVAAKLLAEHPANQFWIGNLESLADKDNSKLHNELLAFYQKHYSANRMKLVLISSDPLPQMQLLAQRFFSDIENKNIESPRPTAQIDFKKFGPKRVHYVPNTESQLLRLEFTIDNNLSDFATKPNKFLAHLLSSEMPGTPAQQLKAMGLLDVLYVDYDPAWYGNYGHLQIVMALTEAGMQQRPAITAIMMQYLDLIRKKGVDQKYFQEIRTSLNNQFNFMEKTDGFSYAAKLSSAMQYYPLASIVSAPYQYDKFDKASIEALLAQLVPERLTVWHISQQEPAKQKLNYFEGRYAIADLSEQEMQSWQQPLIPLSLPELNRFQPESFALKHAKNNIPQKVLDEAGVEAWLAGSQHFTDQPRGQLLLQWHQPSAKRTAKEAILHGMWQLLFILNNQALWQEASAAGMQVQPEAEEYDLVLKLTGFTDKQPALVEHINTILSTPVTAPQFAQTMDLMQRSLRSFEQQVQIRQASEILKTTLMSGRFELDVLLAAAQTITVDELNTYIGQTLAQSQLRVLAQGNYDEADVKKIAAALKGQQKTSRSYQVSPSWQPEPGQRLSVVRSNPQADSTLFRTQFLPNADYAGKAAAKVLSGHLHQAFFNQLRTEEQLGYAVQAFEFPLNQHAGLGFAIQSPVLSAEQLQQRVDLFLQQYSAKLEQLSEQDFTKLQQSQLLELQRMPANLEEEFKTFSNDWLRNRLNFDSRQKLIAAVSALTLADMQHFYRQTVMSEHSATMQIILQGQAKEQALQLLPGFSAIDDLATFHQTF